MLQQIRVKWRHWRASRRQYQVERAGWKAEARMEQHERYADLSKNAPPIPGGTMSGPS
jgi:hypothetical protein